MREPERSASRTAGWTVVELVVVVALIGVAVALSAPWRALDAIGLSRVARVAEVELGRARLHAATRRVPVRVTVAGTWLVIREANGRLVARTDLAGRGLRGLDSVRLRPATLRYNARGQASAGSLYLFRAGRGIRLVSNFVGRVRRQSFRY